MGFILDLLASPVLGPIRVTHWLAEKMAEEAERQYFDEDRVRAELLGLQTRYDLGEVSQNEYDDLETIMLGRLQTIREMKAERDNRQ